jgi:YqaJ-like viral recombinase domain
MSGSSTGLDTNRKYSALGRQFIGGSDARIIMGTDEAALTRLWCEKRGEAKPEDLSGNLIVQLGVVTEDLNRHWYERNTGQAIKDVQRRVNHPVVKWMAATLDGVVEASGAVFEAKFMLPWSFSEEGAAGRHHTVAISPGGRPDVSLCIPLGRARSRPQGIGKIRDRDRADHVNRQGCGAHSPDHGSRSFFRGVDIV